MLPSSRGHTFQNMLPVPTLKEWPPPPNTITELPTYSSYTWGDAQAWEYRNCNVWNAKKLFCSPTIFLLKCCNAFFVSQQQFKNFALINLGKEYLHTQTNTCQDTQYSCWNSSHPLTWKYVTCSLAISYFLVGFDLKSSISIYKSNTFIC